MDILNVSLKEIVGFGVVSFFFAAFVYHVIKANSSGGEIMKKGKEK